MQAFEIEFSPRTAQAADRLCAMGFPGGKLALVLVSWYMRCPGDHDGAESAAYFAMGSRWYRFGGAELLTIPFLLAAQAQAVIASAEPASEDPLLAYLRR